MIRSSEAIRTKAMLRIVYLPRIEVLKDATEKLTDFLSCYRQ